MPLEELIAELNRQKNNSTWAEFAATMGMDTSTLWRIMNAKRTPRLETLEQLFDAHPDLRRIFFSPNRPIDSTIMPNDTEVES